MKATDAVVLNEWVLGNRAELGGRTIKDNAAKASEDLGFKVPTNALRELMHANGIETRRQSARQAEKMAMLSEIERLTAENMELRRSLAKVYVSDIVPDDMKEFIFSGLKEEILQQIKDR